MFRRTDQFVFTVFCLMLTVCAANAAFSDWQTLHFSANQLSDSTVSGVLANPVGDGTPNLEKYAFDLDPWAPAQGGLPTLDLSGTVPGFTYRKLKTSTDLLYHFQYSTDLINWITPNSPVELASLDGGTVFLKTLQTPLSTAPCYCRMQILNSSVEPFSRPSNLRSILLPSNLVELFWTDNSATETGFEILRKGLGDLILVPIGTTGPDTNSYIDLNVVSGATYIYSIRAVKGLTKTGYGALSTQITTQSGIWISELAKSAVQTVVSQIKSATLGFGLASGTTDFTNRLAWASQPGMIRTWDSNGNPYGAYKLYSSNQMTLSLSGSNYDPSADQNDLSNVAGTSGAVWNQCPALYTDLNSPVISSSGVAVAPIIDPNLATGTPGSQITYSGSAIEGFAVTQPSTFNAGAAISPGNNPVPMPVRWLYVLKDGEISTPVANGTNSVVFNGSNNQPIPTALNPIIGRIAFWADDESCKVNINTASEGSFWDVPRVNNLEEHGNLDLNWTGTTPNMGIAPWGLSTAVPLFNEYQRIPGHPATTCLSPVLSSAQFTNFFGISPIPAYPEFIQSGTGNTPYSFIQPYYSLSPRVADGGTDAGTMVSSSDSVPVVKTNPLYNSVDALAYDSSGHIQLAGSVMSRTKFFLTAHSRAPEVNLFNLPRISIWPLQTASNCRNAIDNLFASCGTINGQPYFFQRYQASYSAGASGSPVYLASNDATPGSSQSTTDDWLQIPRNQQLLTSPTASGYLPALANTPIPGFGGTFSSKYPLDYEQILTEIFDYIRTGVNTVNWSGTTSNYYSYTPLPYVPGSSYTQLAGGNSSVPSQITYPETGNTQGFGRTYTIREVGISFIAAGWQDTTHFALSGSNSIYGLFPTFNGTTPITSGTIYTLPENWAGAAEPTGAKITSSITASQVQTDSLGHPLYGTPITDGAGHILPPLLGAHGTGPSSVPDDAPDDAGLYTGVGKPRTSSIQSFIFLTPFNVNPGQPAPNPSLRYQISGMENFTITYNGVISNMGFPNGSNAVEVVRNGGNLLTLVTGEAGFLRQFLNPNYGARTLGIGTGSTSTSGISDSGGAIFPFVSGIIPLSGTAPISRFIMDGTAAQHDLIGSYSDMIYDGKGTTSHTHSYTTARATGPSTFNFSGGPITIKIYTGNQTSVAGSQLIQTLNINVPGGTFPLPQVVRASPPILSGSTYGGGDCTFALPTTNNGPNANPMSGGNPYKDAAFYTGFNLVSGVPNATPSDSRYLNQRFSGSYPVAGSSYSGFTYPGFPLPEGSGISGNQSNYVNPGIPTAANQGATIVNRYGVGYAGNTMATSQYGGLFRRGDVIRSIGIDPNGPSGGDIRLVAGLNNVPSNYFAPLAGYSDSTRYQIHSMYYDTGNLRQPSAFADVLGTNPYLWNTAGAVQGVGGHYLISNPRGSLLNGTSNGYDGTITTAVQGQRGAFLSTQTGFYPGDWDNGIGNIPDGGYLNKPDEGYSSIVGFASVYFQANGVSFTTPTQLSFSPNRQIPSPVMFGSLPTGMLSGNPWQTLLFCPNPASELGNHSVGAAAHHPGFGTSVSGVPGPGALPPFVKPPDHLLLDWFWMPVVQPYAISDPLSTAGKVNMNFQILPFTYIERSTGVRAVLKNVKVQAIPARAANIGQSYKNIFNANVDSKTPSFRYDINRDETISGGFDARFSGTNGTVPDIFRSASEICNVFLVPQEQVGAQSPPASVSYGDSIAPPAPTGGYAGTANWWDSYQLTGDSSRESPYNQIYPRLTTKSNTFQVHYRVQMLNKQANSDPTVWTEGVDQVGVESRGYQVIERDIDPTNPLIPDYATQPLIQTPISNFYNFYTLESKLFTP